MHCHTVTGSRGQPVCLQPQFIRVSSTSFVYLLPRRKSEPQFIRMCANSFVYLPSPKKLNHIEPQCIRMSSNSFVYLPISSYIFPLKNMNPNSFVYLPIHSYIFSRKTSQCAQQSVLLLSHSQSSGCHTVAIGIFTQWVLGFCLSFVREWGVKLPGSRPLACHTVSP